MVNNISRRSFNKCVIGGTMLLCSKASAIGYTPYKKGMDALVHIAPDGVLYIYSGIAHLGQHGSEDAITPVCEILQVKNYQLMVGASPAHLPAMLGQHETKLCFTSSKTNIKAAQLMKSFLSIGVRTGLYIENGVSSYTRTLASSLDLNGMTIAVKA